MPGKMSDPRKMPKKIMRSGRDVGEDEESRHDAKKIMKFGQAPEKGSVHLFLSDMDQNTYANL